MEHEEAELEDMDDNEDELIDLCANYDAASCPDVPRPCAPPRRASCRLCRSIAAAAPCRRRATFAAPRSRAAAVAPLQGRRWGKEMAWERKWGKDRSDRRERKGAVRRCCLCKDRDNGRERGEEGASAPLLFNFFRGG